MRAHRRLMSFIFHCLPADHVIWLLCSSHRRHRFPKHLLRICMSIYSDATIAKIKEHILTSLGGLAVPEPTVEESLSFLKLSENHSIGLKNWCLSKIGENYTWNETTMGKICLSFVIRNLTLFYRCQSNPHTGIYLSYK